VLPRDLAEEVPLLVLVEHREVVGQQHELLAEDRRDRIKQAGETRVVDRLRDRRGKAFRDVAVDAGYVPEHLRVLAERREAGVERLTQTGMIA